MEQFLTPITMAVVFIVGVFHYNRMRRLTTALAVSVGIMAPVWALLSAWLCWPDGTGTIKGGLLGQWLLMQARLIMPEYLMVSAVVCALSIIVVMITGASWWFTRVVQVYTYVVGKKGKQDIGDVAHVQSEPEAYHKPYLIKPLPEAPVAPTGDKSVQMGQELAHVLQEKLQQYGVSGRVTQVISGPLVIRIMYEPRADVKVSKVLAREDDVALALKATSLRILAPLPGTNNVAFEVARTQGNPVLWSAVYARTATRHMRTDLPLIIGVDTVGKPILIDLAQQPHMLIAGTTGSGKSVLMHSFIVSLLYRHNPDALKMLMIDPKYLEYGRYARCGHLLAPIAHQPEHALKVLQYAVRIMEERYQLMGSKGVRHAAVYHAHYGDMPPIVIIIDELADLMMVAGKEIERALVRLAQMARAASIHVIMATQRPSVDVVTGLLKSNFPARIALKVSSKIDSRTILDQQGAEKLLGKGDLLYLQPQGTLIRAHGAYLTEDELEDVIAQVEEYGPPFFDPTMEHFAVSDGARIDSTDDALLQEIVEYVQQQQQISISLLQRRFRIGYNRSARLMQELEERGYVVPYSGTSKMRKVLRKVTT